MEVAAAELMARIKTLQPRVATLDTRTAPPEVKRAEPFYSSSEWRSLVERLIATRGRRCQVCGRARRVVGDHVKELKDGGAPLDERNVLLTCWPCHTTKSNAARAARQKAGVGEVQSLQAKDPQPP